MKTKVLFSKKIILIFIAIIFSFVLVSCNKEDLEKQEDDKKIATVKEVKNKVSSALPMEIKEDSAPLEFTPSVDGVTITYKSNNEKVISNDGTVSFPASDTFVTIDISFSITLSTGEYKEDASLLIVVRKGKTDSEKFEEIKKDVLSKIPSEVKGNIDFITSSLYGSIISYSTSKEEILSKDGVAKADVIGSSVTIFVSILLNGTLYEPFEVDVVVKTKEIDSASEQKLTEIEMEVIDAIEFGIIKEDIDLLKNSVYDSVIRYESSNEEVLSSDGKVGEDVSNKSVTLYFYITLDGFEYGPFNIILTINTHVNVNENEYYNDISSDLTGNSLKMALRTLITNTQSYTTTYDDIKTVTARTDADPDKPGNIILFYSRVSVSAKWDGGKTWNREHVWPRSKSWFQYEDAGSDIHHLRPTNPSINSSRGNKPYAMSTTSTTYGPTDEVKGDIARIVFYLLTRYPESDSYPITNVATSMKMLLEWNELDPVDNLEIVRNEECYKIQGNRNPFIDYPDYANMIWSTQINTNQNIIDYFIDIYYAKLDDILESKYNI